MARRPPGAVRDALIQTLSSRREGASMPEIVQGVSDLLGDEVARSSVRSYLRLNTPGLFERIGRGRYRLKETS